MQVVNYFQRQPQAAKNLYIGLPVCALLCGAGYAYKLRRDYLADPVLQRAILHLKKDQRVIDFCGENIQPGLIMSRLQSPGENWIKYQLTMSGASGKLKTTLIGDFLSHQELEELEQERKTYQDAVDKLSSQSTDKKASEEAKTEKQGEKKSGWFGKSKSVDQAKASEPPKEKANADKQLQKIKEQYVPIDFEAYTIDDKNSKVLAQRSEEEPLPKEVLEKPIDKSEKLWRISSLTASVDDETKILILPLPESKRKVKVAQTKYDSNTYGDLVQKIDTINTDLSAESDTSGKRFDDKTQEEIQDEMVRKRKQQFGKLMRIRYYQLGGLIGMMFIYLVVYRRFLYPTPVMHSVAYNQALSLIRESKQVKNKIGARFQVMNCNGKMYPYRKDVKFDIVLFGTNQNGKVKVTSYFDKEDNTWHIRSLNLVTRQEQLTLI